VLRDGDLVSLDCGAVLDGWHGDAAITVGVGEVDPSLLRLAEVAEDAMWAGIAAAARGAASGRGRLTDISHAVESAVRSAGRYGIVDGYGGHGIGTEMHQDPHVLNHGRPGKGPRLVPGLALAIEPMITLGSPRTAELDDGWTVVTRDGSVAAHVEHSMALLDDGVWVLTAPDGGRARLGDLVTQRQSAHDPAC
jgi:methionyl aminopeptidase